MNVAFLAAGAFAALAWLTNKKHFSDKDNYRGNEGENGLRPAPYWTRAPEDAPDQKKPKPFGEPGSMNPGVGIDSKTLAMTPEHLKKKSLVFPLRDGDERK